MKKTLSFYDPVRDDVWLNQNFRFVDLNRTIALWGTRVQIEKLRAATESPYALVHRVEIRGVSHPLDKPHRFLLHPGMPGGNDGN